MLSSVNKRICVFIMFVFATGCAGYSLEHDFFHKPLHDAKIRMNNYSLEDQYKIFRYGNDVVHPPMLELADPIAKHGRAAVPFLMEKLANEDDDIGIRDIVLIFQWMSLHKTYDVKADQVLMNALTRKIDSMKTWKDTALEMMMEIKSASK